MINDSSRPSCKINIRVQHHFSPDSPRPIPIHSVPLEDELRIPGRLECHLHKYGISSLLSTKVTPLKQGRSLPSFFYFLLTCIPCPLLVWVARSIYLGLQNRAIVYKVPFRMSVKHNLSQCRRRISLSLRRPPLARLFPQSFGYQYVTQQRIVFGHGGP